MSHISSSLRIASGHIRPLQPSAAVLGTCTVGEYAGGWLPSHTALVEPAECCSEPGPGPARTLLTVLTVFSTDVRILITLRSGSAFTTERNIDAKRPKKCLRPTQAAGEGARSFGHESCRLSAGRSMLIRSRSAALPFQKLRSLMSSRTQAAIGSASIMPSIAALRLAL